MNNNYKIIENLEEVQKLSNELVSIILENKTSYADACEAFNIARENLAKIPLKK